MQASSNEDNVTLYKQCSLFQLRSVPLFGVYGRNYTIMPSLAVMKSKKQPSSLPPHLLSLLNPIHSYSNKPEFEYFHITLDGTYVYNDFNEARTGSTFARINMIAHSYIFYNVGAEREHKTVIYPSLFTDNEYSESVIKDSNENDGLRINPPNITDPALKREIILHKGEESHTALSPNNCALLINLNSPLLHFYLVIFVTYDSKIVKCCVAEYVLFPALQKMKLFAFFYKQLSSSALSISSMMISVFYIMNLYRDYYLTLFGFFMSDLAKVMSLSEFRQTFFKSIEFIYEGYEKASGEMGALEQFEYSEWVKFINVLFDSKDFPQFDEKYIEENCNVKALNDSYLVELLQKWIRAHLGWVNDVFSGYFAFVGLNKEIIEAIESQEGASYALMTKGLLQTWIKSIGTTEEVFIERIKDVNQKPRMTNRNIAILKRVLDAILQGNKQNERLLLSQLDKNIEDYLYFQVWKFKGKLLGIHHHFGRLSFNQQDGIQQHYHCSDNERFELVNIFITELEKIDKDY